MSRSRAWILIVAIASLATSHRAERTHEPLYDVSVHVGPGEPVCLDVPPAQPTGRPTCEKSLLLLPDNFFDDAKMYPREPNFGTFCGFHDKHTAPLCNGPVPPAWCSKAWCFVTMACIKDASNNLTDAAETHLEHDSAFKLYATYMNCDSSNDQVHAQHLSDWR
ncbi:unnamed protein product [Effrenium voratum]|uniref:Secreted protein n=1 Tax=Effrenium voratum TaxID=2562239 RepID=A0AA36IKF7_9DINO|nr:unnamed protein product [Effrenium voratum]